MTLHFDMERLKELLTDFHTLNHVRVSVYDADWEKLLAYPERSSSFCELLKANPASKKRCKACDHAGMQACRQRNGVYIYRCHAGLTEVVAPIRMEETTIGYMMFGQVIDPVAKKAERKELLDYAAEFCQDRTKIEKAFDKLRSRDERQVRSAAKIIEACACYLWMNQLVRMDTKSLRYELMTYIEEHLAEDLSVDRLCRLFDVSRSRLFELSKQFFGVSISRYIKRRRIHTAAKLLMEQRCRVNEAAERVGILDYNYFSKIFKAEMGCKPSVYGKAE